MITCLYYPVPQVFELSSILTELSRSLHIVDYRFPSVMRPIWVLRSENWTDWVRRMEFAGKDLDSRKKPEKDTIYMLVNWNAYTVISKVNVAVISTIDMMIKNFCQISASESVAKIQTYSARLNYSKNMLNSDLTALVHSRVKRQSI